MFTTIINDCKDDNARARQTSRVGSLMNTSLSFIGVDSDIEAGMQLIDILDATSGREGLILVNVAPRGGHTTKWENGTPFGYLWYKKTLIISSLDGYTLSAIKKLKLADKVNILDIHIVSDLMQSRKFISKDEADRIPFSQFRSFDFIPRVGVFMTQGNHVPSSPYDLNDTPDLPSAIWNIDNFGNCKTTLTTDDIKDHSTKTRYGTLPYHEKLRDVPDETTAIVKGSSGIYDVRFLEILSQKKDFSKISGAKIGDDIFTEKSYFKTATS